MKNIILICLIITIMMFGCKKETHSKDTLDQKTSFYGFTDEDLVKGRLRIKLDEDPENEISVREDNAKTITGINILDSIAQILNISHIERTFPYAGQFEERTKREGLHLWYDLWFSEEHSITRSANDMDVLSGVQIVSPIVKIEAIGMDKEAYSSGKFYHQRSLPCIFNDPMIPHLWNYHNDGSKEWQELNADIRLFDVWEEYNGHPSVIVAVVDGGIDTNHPDIMDK